MTWTSEFFLDNRQRLSERIDGGVIVLSANHQQQRRGDMAHVFAQESNFWYLTGIDAPDWRMIYDSSRNKLWMVQPPKNDLQELFEGAITNEAIMKISGADEVIQWSEHEALLRQLARKHSQVYALDPVKLAAQYHHPINPGIIDVHVTVERIFANVSDVRQALAMQRAIKNDKEISAIKKAVKLTVEAFDHVHSTLEKYRHEYEIEAEFGYMFRRHNATHAYDPIVASGVHACTLHYGKNSAKRTAHAGVLIDIGAELGGYCADITRTYAWGEPTARFVDLHQALQAAQQEIIRLIEPYMPLVEYEKQVDVIMKRAMMTVGLLSDDKDSRYRMYFPHAVSHGLGIDVHDSLGGHRAFEPGMVVTVEPGLYVPEAGIGMRIEDDIVVTETGRRNLSAGISHQFSL